MSFLLHVILAWIGWYVLAPIAFVVLLCVAIYLFLLVRDVVRAARRRFGRSA